MQYISIGDDYEGVRGSCEVIRRPATVIKVLLALLVVADAGEKEVIQENIVRWRAMQ